MGREDGGWRPAPVIEWVIREAWRIRNPRKLVDEFCARLVAEGVPLWRFRAHIPALHPEVFGDSYLWRREVGRTEYSTADHSMRLSDEYRLSPLHVVGETRRMLRRRLVGSDAKRDYPLLERLKADGGTDYVALPLEFNDGSNGYATYASDGANGFTDRHLEVFRDLTVCVTRLAENLAIRQLAIRILDIYVGHDAGARILAGQVMRGSGDTINAAIWFCDLRGFTAMSDSLPREQLIELLNAYFDRMAGPVNSHGGEILKFIGDGMLAIFRVDESRDQRAASGAALQAAVDAAAAMGELNRDRKAASLAELGFGISLHMGDVMYGNIGATGRLDFTVIGPAVNLVNRMQALCRDLEREILVSADFAAEFIDGTANGMANGMANGIGSRLVSLGHHRLRGVGSAQEVFGLV